MLSRENGANIETPTSVQLIAPLLFTSKPTSSYELVGPRIGHEPPKLSEVSIFDTFPANAYVTLNPVSVTWLEDGLSVGTTYTTKTAARTSETTTRPARAALKRRFDSAIPPSASVTECARRVE